MPIRVRFLQTDPNEIIGRDDVDLVAIATRHDSHAELAALALEAGKTVYVEKPLCLDWEGSGAGNEPRSAARGHR